MNERKLRRKNVLSVMENLIYEYSKPDFQTKLHAIDNGSCNPTAIKEMYQELSAIRFKTIELFGFAPCKRGWEMFGRDFAQCGFDPDVRHISNQLDILTSPKLQGQLNRKEYDITFQLSASLICAHENLQKKVAKFRDYYAEEISSSCEGEFGRLWTVVGGQKSNGIIVRTGHDLRSAALITRLKCGATVRELNLIGARLHFEKLSGKGPMYGWISIMLKDTKLLQMLSVPKMVRANEVKVEEEIHIPEIQELSISSSRSRLANEVKEELEIPVLETKERSISRSRSRFASKIEEELESPIAETGEVSISLSRSRLATEVMEGEEIPNLETEELISSLARSRLATDMTETSTCISSTPMHDMDFEDPESD